MSSNLSGTRPEPGAIKGVNTSGSPEGSSLKPLPSNWLTLVALQANPLRLSAEFDRAAPNPLDELTRLDGAGVLDAGGSECQKGGSEGTGRSFLGVSRASGNKKELAISCRRN